MKTNRHRFRLTAALLFALAAFAAGPGAAHDGEQHGGGAASAAAVTAATTSVPETQFELEVINTSANDPLLGDEVPVEKAAVKATVKHGNEVVLSDAAHAEEGAGVYGVHGVLDQNGPHTMRWEIAPKNGAPFTVEFPLQVAGAPEERSATFLSGWRLPAAAAGGIALLATVFVVGRLSGGGNGKNGHAARATTLWAR